MIELLCFYFIKKSFLFTALHYLQRSWQDEAHYALRLVRQMAKRSESRHIQLYTNHFDMWKCEMSRLDGTIIHPHVQDLLSFFKKHTSNAVCCYFHRREWMTAIGASCNALFDCRQRWVSASWSIAVLNGLLAWWVSPSFDLCYVFTWLLYSL